MVCIEIWWVKNVIHILSPDASNLLKKLLCGSNDGQNVPDQSFSSAIFDL